MFLFLLVVQLVLQSRLFPIDEVLMFDDSMIILHKICQLLMSCPYNLLLAFVTVQEISVNFSLSLAKFWFCTDKIVSIECQDLVPRQRVDDCSEIHLPR